MCSEVLEIKKKDAVEAYKSADGNGKTLLKKLFPNQVLSGNIRDEIQTFEDVERITGKKITRRPDETDDELAYRQKKLIAEAYNQGRQLDPKNQNQYKYYPVFQLDESSPSGLSFFVDSFWGRFAFVGVRLCFVDSEDAVDAGKKFHQIEANFKIN
jgi:bifunctional DNA-binding transcriptional regulator/antitoxin component of YhaV-PrlF toxin-antitoxin module